MRNLSATWYVEEVRTGMKVARGSAVTTDDAVREATHYAVQYAQDGPVRWCVRQNSKVVLRGSMAGLSITTTIAP